MTSVSYLYKYANSLIQYIKIDKNRKMLGAQNSEKPNQTKVQGTESGEVMAQNNQALPKQKLESPFIKVEFGHQIVFTYINPSEKKGEFFSWLWKDDSTIKNNQTIQSLSNSILSSPSQKSVPQELPKKETMKRKAAGTNSGANKKVEQKLYSEDEVSLLKKKLQFQYKGLLSKSTESDSTLGVPVLIRFRCKNSNHTNPCPFFHLLQYCREEDGKVLYRHREQCSNHTPECTLDDQNIQYNVIARKLDSSMSILEDIIRQDYAIKPKQILQVFASRIGEADQNFLYEGLHTKSVRRSIKKYFDNAVAKIKSKLRQF